MKKFKIVLNKETLIITANTRNEAKNTLAIYKKTFKDGVEFGPNHVNLTHQNPVSMLLFESNEFDNEEPL